MSARKGAEKYWIGFDLGGTKMQAAVYDGRFRPLAVERTKTRALGGKAEGLKRMLAAIRAALRQAALPSSAVAGLGVGIPTALDLERGFVPHFTNLGWRNMPLKNQLEKALKIPAVIVNDVDAGIYAEYRFGAARGARCAVGVFPGTGIGGGCVYEGRILRGRRYSCFELGHIRVQPKGPFCGCGQRGCLEALAGRLAISAACAAAAYRGEAPHLLQECGTDLGNIRSGALAKAIAAGDREVEAIVRDAARWLGIGVAAAVNLLAPDVVVLGGGLVEALPDLYLAEVSQKARARVMALYRDVFQVRVAKLGDHATALGAAAWARQALEEK